MVNEEGGEENHTSTTVIYMLVYDHPYGSQYLDPKVKSSIVIYMLILEARIESTNKDMRDIYDTIRT